MSGSKWSSDGSGRCGDLVDDGVRAYVGACIEVSVGWLLFFFLLSELSLVQMLNVLACMRSCIVCIDYDRRDWNALGES